MLNSHTYIPNKLQILFKLKVILLLFIICVLYTIFIVNILPLSYSLDSEIIEDMVLYEVNEFQLFSSYGNVALLYELLPDIFLTPWANSLLVFICLSLLVTKTKFTITNYFILGVSLLCYIYMGRVSKDIIIFCLLTIFYLCKNLRLQFKYFAFIVLYLVYGLIFRNYFLFILFVFLMLPTFFKRPLLWGGLIFITLIILPSSIYEFIYQSKMEINIYRLYESDVRTIILNPSNQMNLFGFLINYIYSFIVINLPIFFGLKFQDLIVIFMNYIIWFSLINKIKTNDFSNDSFNYEYLLLSHLLVMYIFEPDIGSYFRHLLAYTPLIVIVLEKQNTLQILTSKFKILKWSK